MASDSADNSRQCPDSADSLTVPTVQQYVPKGNCRCPLCCHCRQSAPPIRLTQPWYSGGGTWWLTSLMSTVRRVLPSSVVPSSILRRRDRCCVDSVLRYC
eukprot:1354072-Prymnesium_polylepis.1